jgi:hypothetical protein
VRKQSESKRNYDSLAVNERLLVSGLLEQFDAAANRRDRDRMISMLRRVELSLGYAAKWVDALLEDQTLYRHWTDGDQPIRRSNR